MTSAEWLGVTTLAVATLGFLVASLALFNQLASTKRPIPDVSFTGTERIAQVLRPATSELVDVAVAALVITVTNRGHEPMLNPCVYDWTKGNVLFKKYPVEHSMPQAISPGDTLEVVTSYSLANKNHRVIGIVWEEASLFGRKPAIRGVLFRIPSNGGTYFHPPSERWRRVGPFHRKGWQARGHIFSLWRPVLWARQDPGSGYVWANIRPGFNPKTSEENQLVYEDQMTKEIVVAGRDLSKDEVQRMRRLGWQLPGD